MALGSWICVFKSNGRYFVSTVLSGVQEQPTVLLSSDWIYSNYVAKSHWFHLRRDPHSYRTSRVFHSCPLVVREGIAGGVIQKCFTMGILFLDFNLTFQCWAQISWKPLAHWTTPKKTHTHTQGFLLIWRLYDHCFQYQCGLHPCACYWFPLWLSGFFFTNNINIKY